MNETLRLLMQRKTVRRYADRPIAPREKDAILSAAMRAPTAGNMMLYSIIDVTDPLLKQRLSETCDHQPFIADAPMVLVFCADYRRWMRKFASAGCDGGKPEPPLEGNFLLACCDTLIAAQTAVVAAESLGIGSCYIGDMLENCETQAELLRLPKYVAPVTLVAFGYPTEQQKERQQPSRFTRDSIVFENGYRDLTEEELDGFAADRNMEAFYRRKHASAFSHEMNRSAREILHRWITE